MRYLVTQQIISGLRICWLDLFGLHLAELQFITTLSILLQTHCVNSSQADVLFSSVRLVPIRFVGVLLPRLLFTRHWTKTVTAFISHLELFSFWTGWELDRIKAKSHCDLRSINQEVLVSSPLIFISLWQLRSCFCGVPFLTRGRVSLLYVLLALASVVFLESESLGTRDHIFTVSELTPPFPSPPTTRRVTVEVFEPASTRVTTPNITRVALYILLSDRTENSASVVVTCLTNYRIATVATLTAANSYLRCFLPSNEQ
jgi:hypothetical protein